MPFIGEISVILPDKSTAILPDAWAVNSGHPTGMDPAIILANIEARLKALGLSADRAARQAGTPDAIRNLRRAVENGKGGINMRTLTLLARQLKTSPAALLAPPDAVSDEQQLRDLLLAQRELIDRLIAGNEPRPDKPKSR